MIGGESDPVIGERFMRMARIVLMSMALSAPAAVHAGEIGNATEGLAYARAHCAECHRVETPAEDTLPTEDAPDFVTIANTPGMTERALIVWLQTSHPTMPNLIIPAEERDDVVAYIMSLRQK